MMIANLKKFKKLRESLEEKPININKFPFGKYCGETVKLVVNRNPEYVIWFARNVKRYKIDEKIVSQASLIISKALCAEVPDYLGSRDYGYHEKRRTRRNSTDTEWDSSGDYGSENLFRGEGSPWGDD